MSIDIAKLDKQYEEMLESAGYDLTNMASKSVHSMQLHRINKNLGDLIDVLEKIERRMDR